MARADGKIMWTVEMSNAELTLVLKALDGRLEEKHMEAAHALGADLLNSRLGQTKAMLNAFEKLERNVAAKQGEADGQKNPD